MKDFGEIKNILAIKLRNIGDVLLTVPALRALKETFPGARLSVLVNSGTEQMLTLNPIVDDVIVFDRSIKKGAGRRITGETRFIRELRKRRFSMTVDFTGGDRAAITGLLTGAGIRLGHDPRGKGLKGKRYFYTHLAPPAEPGTHTILRDLGLLRAFGIDTAHLRVDIHVSREDEAIVDEIIVKNNLGRFVHVHPVSRWLFKCWSPERVAAVLDALVGDGLDVVVTSGPAPKEREYVKEVGEAMKEKARFLSGSLTLKQMAALSKRAVLFFGVDTAPMHIAAATGIPVVALFGPSGAFDWGPWDNGAAAGLSETGLKTPYPKRCGIQRFGKNLVIQQERDCIPCGRDGCEGTKKSDCLLSMKAEEVIPLLREAAALSFPEGSVSF